MTRLFIVVVLTLIGLSHQEEGKCDPITDPGDPSNLYPDFNDALNHPYSMVVEMVDVINKETYNVREIRARSEMYGLGIDMTALVFLKNNTETLYHYYADQKKFFKIENNKCTDVTGDDPPLNYWGWFDTNADHGQSLFGPGALLRFSYSFELESDNEEGPEVINGIECNRWKGCEGGQLIELHYMFSTERWSMPELGFFTDAHGGFPVQMEVKKTDNSEHYLYNIDSFVPFVSHEHYLRIPEGFDCESLLDLNPEFPKPTIVDNFEVDEELVINSMLNGQQNGTQIVENIKFYYSKDLSLVRFDGTPVSKDDLEKDEDDVKVVHDFNTGVQYIIDKVQGNCTKSFIPIDGFDNIGLNHIGEGGSMLGPNEMFRLDDKYVVAGVEHARHQGTLLWTSTRHDIPDPNHPQEFLKKAVMDYYFIKTDEQTSDGNTKDLFTPLRNDFFLYDQDHIQNIIFQQTVNFMGFSETELFSEDKFQVSECYDYDTFDWSYIYLFFQAKPYQINAAKNVPEIVKHQIYKYLVEFGSISPVRISALDISDGISGPGNNVTTNDLMIVSVRLLEKAADLYRFGVDPSNIEQFPGKNEIKVSHVGSAHHCATLCTETTSINCVAFHICKEDGLCFLSKTDGKDGEEVPDLHSCEHWMSSLVNRTFVDTPSYKVDDALMQHIDEIVLEIPNDNSTVKIMASEAVHLLSPDPFNYVRVEFTFTRRDTTFRTPNKTIENVKTFTDCETYCLTNRAFRCEGIAYEFSTKNCLLSALHYEEMVPDSDLIAMSEAFILSRSYIFDYSPVFGGVSLNTTGTVINDVISFETCARMCSNAIEECNSFEYCSEERICKLHKEHYLDVAHGDIDHHSKCVHFSKKGSSNFKSYSSQSLPVSDHTLFAISSDEASCAHECLKDVESETCESYDFCTECVSADSSLCGEENIGYKNLCFLSKKHIGEEGVNLAPSKKCIHYSREVFGDQDYNTWKNGGYSRSSSDDGSGYTSGDMAGLAFGMIFLAVALSLGFLALMAYFKPSTVPQEFNVSFKNTVSTSDI